MKFIIFYIIIFHINFPRSKHCKKVIAYQITNYIYTTSHANTKNGINFTFRRLHKLIILKFSHLTKC